MRALHFKHPAPDDECSICKRYLSGEPILEGYLADPAAYTPDRLVYTENRLKYENPPEGLFSCDGGMFAPQRTDMVFTDPPSRYCGDGTNEARATAPGHWWATWDDPSGRHLSLAFRPNGEVYICGWTTSERMVWNWCRIVHPKGSIDVELRLDLWLWFKLGVIGRLLYRWQETGGPQEHFIHAP